MAKTNGTGTDKTETNGAETDLQLDLMVEAAPWRELPQLDQRVQRAALAALQTARSEQSRSLILQGPCAITVKLSDDATVQQLNQRFRGKDQPTNVLSFPFENAFPQLAAEQFDGPSPLGDLILACQTVWREAGEQGKPIDHHLAHLVVHGVLHLLGYDHQETAPAEHMEHLEELALATLGIGSPYRCA